MALMKQIFRPLVAAIGITLLFEECRAVEVDLGWRSQRLRSSSQRDHAASPPSTAEGSSTTAGGSGSATTDGSADDWIEPKLPKVYRAADDVARYLEKRAPVAFATEGAKPDVDITASQEKTLRHAFEETPDIFKSCVLIRDFATPLRVGSALDVSAAASRLRRSSRSGRRNLRSAPGGEEDEADDGDDGDDPSAADTSDEAQGTEHHLPPMPDLMTSGGVVDRDEAPDGKEDTALLEITMMAYLQSVTGHVSVVPVGDVAKWSSKMKVPIAGYLCTDSGSPVLHTLPTPCVATSLADDGTLAMPPPMTATPSEEPVRGPSPAVAGSPSPALAFLQQGSHHGSHRHGHRHQHKHARRHVLHRWQHRLRRHARQTTQATFGVYVGSLKLHFTSKKKADKFCRRLTRKIAEDPGDNEWDTEKLKGEVLDTDIKLSTFVQLARKDPPQAWTTGKKKVLVMVMDWQAGDRSKAPLSEQTMTPAYVRDTIFPQVQRAFREMSFGKFEIEFEVVPEVVRYTKARSRYVLDGYPFPGLYNGAVESLRGSARFGDIDISDYDLVYTLSPQQAPIGTKGVAWVGAKGAMCNGCEAVSESMQVMVAVHELGHNLGLSHASSSSLEYGNPFDWMGNYPDVQGLSYGLGYKLKLHWLPRSSVAHITDAGLSSLNDRYILQPFDVAQPGDGQLVGVQLTLKRNPRDLYIAFRKTTGKEAGIYLVLQDREKPDSELIDMACHTISQKDARLRPGWSYVDPSGQVVIVVEEVSDDAAKVHLYKAPGASDLKAIRARDTYSDGTNKCPRTCTDADLLVASVDTCSALSSKGYCGGGSITMSGRKMSIGDDLCPESCKNCESALSGSPFVGAGGGGGCSDRKIRIDGMACPLIAQRGHCEANTNVGHVGRDLCPRSCGHCPPVPVFAAAGQAGSYDDPVPARSHGVGGSPSPADDADAAAPTAAATTAAPTTAAPEPEEEPEDEEEDHEDDHPLTEHPTDHGESEEDEDPCYDVDDWKDVDGDGCSVYKETIAKGTLTQQEACGFGDGEAMQYCRKTCGVCTPRPRGAGSTAGTCADDPVWVDPDGDNCEIYKEYISEGQITRHTACNYGNGAASEYCKKTCGTCHGQPTHSAIKGKGGTCEDEPCVSQWLKKTGQCFRCEDWPVRCTEEGFAKDCPRTCGTCKKEPGVVVEGGPEDGDGGAADDDDDDDGDGEAPTCQDDDCIEHWREESGGKCLKCGDFAAEYCGNDRKFMEACPKTCRLCVPGEKPQGCRDLFELRTCQEYESMGWCSQEGISQSCMQTCGLCKDALPVDDYPYNRKEGDVEEAARPGGPPRSAASGQSSGAVAASLLAVLFSILC